MFRKLGTFERALALSDRQAPFNVISALQLENPPEPEAVRAALGMLQSRHPLLRACIKDGVFEVRDAPETVFRERLRHHADQWLEIVEQEMNTRLDADEGLWRGAYLYSERRGELILTFHHAIMDAASGMKLLDELLNACAAPAELPSQELLPPVEARFPPAFKGLKGLLPTLKYAAAQMADEAAYRRAARGKRIPPVRPGGRGFPATLTLPEGRVDALSRRARREQVTLNSLLNAVLTLAVNRHLYGGQRTPMRTFTFADLRPYTVPPTPPDHLANYISMLRFTLEVSGDEDVWQLAKNLHSKIYPALKQGDKFIASAMSERLMKTILALKSMRMGTVALNYGGAAPLQADYHGIHVAGVHGFLSSYPIGPEVSAQARLFNDQLWWDFMFLDSDMGRDLAGRIVGEVQSILEQAGDG